CGKRSTAETFLGSDMVRWLLSVGLASDQGEALAAESFSTSPLSTASRMKRCTIASHRGVKSLLRLADAHFSQ
ncbi:hypothetical protein M9458_019339, partial [Cirrhinus mrigala]